MQNDKKSNGFMRFLRDKGYYIVLLLCAVAVGVSGYLLLSGRSSEPAEQGLSASESSSAQLQQESLPRTAHVAATDGSTPSEQPSDTAVSSGASARTTVTVPTCVRVRWSCSPSVQPQPSPVVTEAFSWSVNSTRPSSDTAV